jgi:pimeloyl-ACP methyl ester carboxylesterase
MLRKTRPHRVLRAVIPGMLALLAGAPAAAAALPAPRVAFAECRLKHPAGLGSVPARCGHLSVPEDPREPAGAMISLAVALIPSLDVRGHRPPLFIVAGGPGQAASDFYAGYAAAFAPTSRTRDIVLLDQRGTGGSNALSCDFPDDFDVAAPAPSVIRELSAKCRAGLKGRPQFYTTSVAVRDLEAVRTALRYDRIALYGVSYGTRVVQHYLRHYPERAAAVVLDGVMQPDRVLGPETPLDAERALGIMFARCAADPHCAAAFPELEARFRALLARIERQPPSVSVPDPETGVTRTVSFDHAQFVGAIRLLNYYSVTTALLPYFIDRASKGDFAPLAAEMLMLGAHLDEQLAYGMNVAVSCAEDVPGFAHVDRAPLERTYLGASQLDELATLCEGWPRGVVDADLFAPLHSHVPALLLSGEADPVTPPSSAARAATGFDDVLSVVVAGQGHGQVAVGCAPQLLSDFLTAGKARGLDASCLARVGADPFVLGPTGPAP